MLCVGSTQPSTLMSPNPGIEESSSSVSAKDHCPTCQVITPHLNCPFLYLLLNPRTVPESRDEHSSGAGPGMMDWFWHCLSPSRNGWLGNSRVTSEPSLAPVWEGDEEDHTGCGCHSWGLPYDSISIKMYNEDYCHFP